MGLCIFWFSLIFAQTRNAFMDQFGLCFTHQFLTRCIVFEDSIPIELPIVVNNWLN